VIKCPIPPDADHPGPAFLRRFDLEVRSLVQLSHPHIVKILDIGSDEGLPFVVLQFLAGGSLRDRMEFGPERKQRTMPVASLRDWLLDVARALDFIHSQNYLHRDVKPDNILFDRFGNAFLTDFGIAKALAAEGRDRRLSAMTLPGYLVGTPSYVAPEVVRAGPIDARADQYALALTVYEVLSGLNPMEASTPSATMVKQVESVAPALAGKASGIPRSLSDAVARGLAKAPSERFNSCVALAQAILADVPVSSSKTAVPRSYLGLVARGVAGRVDCPVCQSVLPVGAGLAGQGIMCKRCQATLRVEAESAQTLALHVVGQPSASWVKGVDTGQKRRLRRPILATGALLVALLAGWLLGGSPLGRRRDDAPPGVPPAVAAGVTINIALGTEKEKWLEEARVAFEQTPEGRPLKVNLVALGPVEAAQAIVDGPGQRPIHVWAPSSSLYRGVFEEEWRSRHGTRPILATASLARSPLVFVIWRPRGLAFLKRYMKFDVRTIAEAIAAPGGWAEIAEKPEWGPFKFGHADPSSSDSGLQMLVLMACELARKTQRLTGTDLSASGLPAFLGGFEPGVTRHGSALCRDGAELMEEMVLRGPSQYDCLLVDENLAVASIPTAAERWGQQGELMVEYPEASIMNDHPYYILDVPWSDEQQRRTAAAFLAFLKSPPMQRHALDCGFRPSEASLPLDAPTSPLVRHGRSGLRIGLPEAIEPPPPEVVRALLDAFRRIVR
jgi:serine/threonine-protein kinase